VKRTMVLVAVLVSTFLGCAKPAENAGVASDAGAAEAVPYAQQIEEWHAGRVERLAAPAGWLSVVGLEWIEEGENTVGADPSSSIVLPAGKAAATIGSIFLESGKLRIEARPDAGVMHDGAPVTALELAPDSSGNPTILTLGTLSFFPIARGERFALRVRDSDAEAIRSFTGIERYPVDEKWRIEGRWVPYDPPKETMVANIVGIEEPEKILGAVEFEIDGTTYRLDPLADSLEEDLFLIFADATSGTETYGAGRYLYSKPPDENGRVIVDFNKAYNPPCVFTAFATCPLPPLQNRLPVAVTAGEKMWGDHDLHLPE
jgi:uncharacterized protein